MASIIDSFNDSINENLSVVKFIVYAIPVYFVARAFTLGKMAHVEFWGSLLTLLLFALITQGINNVRMNKNEILTFNPLKIGQAFIKGLIVVLPHVLLYGYIGYVLTSLLKFDVDIPHFNLILHIIIWSILGSVVLTSYLSFAKYLKISQGYNYKVILESCIDVLVAVLLYSPQLVIAVAILVVPVWYLFTLFHLPLNHWGFVGYCSVVFVMGISMLAHFLAQASYEQIKGNNEEYDLNCQMNLLDEVSERMNGQ